MSRGGVSRWIVATVLGTAGCSYALHPHRTIDGHPFMWHEVASLAPGVPEAEVRRRLGEPLEVVAEGPGVAVWRYHERAQLGGCQAALFGVIPLGDTPIVTADARVHLRDGVVERVESSRRE